MIAGIFILEALLVQKTKHARKVALNKEKFMAYKYH